MHWCLSAFNLLCLHSEYDDYWLLPETTAVNDILLCFMSYYYVFVIKSLFYPPIRYSPTLIRHPSPQKPSILRICLLSLCELGDFLNAGSNSSIHSSSTGLPFSLKLLGCIRAWWDSSTAITNTLWDWISGTTWWIRIYFFNQVSFSPHAEACMSFKYRKENCLLLLANPVRKVLWEGKNQEVEYRCHFIIILSTWPWEAIQSVWHIAQMLYTITGE